MQKLDSGKEHGRPSAPKSSAQRGAAEATEQPEIGIEQVKIPKAALESESSGQHAAVAAFRQQPENAEEHARASGAALACNNSRMRAQPSRSTSIADAAEQKFTAAPGQTAVSEATPACSGQQAAPGSAQQAQPVSSAAAELPGQAAASEASPAACSQQAATSSSRRFTHAQQGVAAALLVVLKRAQKNGKPLREAKLALGLGNPITLPLLTHMPDEGTLPSLKGLEQCADAALLEVLDSLAAHYAAVGVRPLDGLTAAFHEGLGLGQMAMVKMDMAALESASNAQHAAVTAVRQQLENAEEHARALGAALAANRSRLQAQHPRSTTTADAAERKLPAAPGQTAVSEANPACSSQQAAAGSAQQAQPVSSAGAELPRQAAVSGASPTGCGQQAASSSGRRFTQAQQEVAEALMAVLSVEQRNGKPLREAKQALGLVHPTTHPFLAVMPDEGTLPSLKELEQCADAALLEVLDSLAKHYGAMDVRPVDGLSADFMEGLGIGQIATVAQGDGVLLIQTVLAAPQEVKRVICDAFQEFFPGIMECLVRRGEDGKSDHKLGLVGFGEAEAILIAALSVTHEIQAYKEIAYQWDCTIEELMQSLLGKCLFAHDVPLIRKLKTILLKIAEDMMRVPQKAQVIYMSMSLRRYRRDGPFKDNPLVLLLNRIMDIAYENTAGSPIMIAANQAFPGVLRSDIMSARENKPQMEMWAAFQVAIEQQKLTWWEQLIEMKLDKIQESCQCPGLQKTDADIIIHAYREFYESFAKAKGYDAINAYHEYYGSIIAKEMAAVRGGSSLETATAPQRAMPSQTATAPQRAMPEGGTGTRPQRATSKEETPTAQQKKALPKEEAATAPQQKPLCKQESIPSQEKAPPNKPAREADRAEEKHAEDSRTHSKEQASAEAEATPEQKACEAAHEELIAAREGLALAEKAEEAARDNLRVSREHGAQRKTERAKKKQAKKARQRAARAQAAAQDQPAQQEAPSTAQPLAEPDLSSTAPEASALPDIAAQVPVSQNGSRNSGAAKHPWKAAISQGAEGGDADAPAAASSTDQKASPSAMHPRRSAQAAEHKPDGEVSAQSSVALESPTQALTQQPLSSPSPIPTVPARTPSPSMRIGPAAQAPACPAAEEQPWEEGSWQKVRRSRYKQPQQKAAAKGKPSNVVHRMPSLGRVLPEQAAPARPHMTPQQAQRLQVPPVLAAAQNGRPKPEPQGGAMPEQPAPPRLPLASQQAQRLQAPPGSAAAQSGLPVPRLQPADLQLNSPPPEECAADDNDCVVCLDNAREVVFLPCGHMCACQKCTKEVMAAGALCPMCCQAVEHTMAIEF